jgi:hypothetical protein
MSMAGTHHLCFSQPASRLATFIKLQPNIHTCEMSEILLQLIGIDHNVLHKFYLEIPAANEKLNLDVVHALQVLKSSIHVVKVPMRTALNCSLWTPKTKP